MLQPELRAPRWLAFHRPLVVQSLTKPLLRTVWVAGDPHAHWRCRRWLHHRPTSAERLGIAVRPLLGRAEFCSLVGRNSVRPCLVRMHSVMRAFSPARSLCRQTVDDLRCASMWMWLVCTPPHFSAD